MYNVLLHSTHSLQRETRSCSYAKDISITSALPRRWLRRCPQTLPSDFIAPSPPSASAAPLSQTNNRPPESKCPSHNSFLCSYLYKRACPSIGRISLSLVYCLELFLDASSHLYKRPCPSVGRLVGPTLSSKSMKNGLLRHLNDVDSAGRGRKRDEEEGATRRKERRGE